MAKNLYIDQWNNGVQINSSPNNWGSPVGEFYAEASFYDYPDNIYYDQYINGTLTFPSTGGSRGMGTEWPGQREHAVFQDRCAGVGDSRSGGGLMP